MRNQEWKNELENYLRCMITHTIHTSMLLQLPLRYRSAHIWSHDLVSRMWSVYRFLSHFLAQRKSWLTENIVMNQFTIKWDALTYWWDVEEIIQIRESKPWGSKSQIVPCNQRQNDEERQKRDLSAHFFVFRVVFPFSKPQFQRLFWYIRRRLYSAHAESKSRDRTKKVSCLVLHT